jgi:hypothetical protein
MEWPLSIRGASELYDLPCIFAFQREQHWTAVGLHPGVGCRTGNPTCVERHSSHMTAAWVPTGGSAEGPLNWETHELKVGQQHGNREDTDRSLIDKLETEELLWRSHTDVENPYFWVWYGDYGSDAVGVQYAKGPEERRDDYRNGGDEWKWYSGRKITASLSYVTENGEGKMERARGSKTAKSLETFFSPFNFDTIGGMFMHWLLHYTVFCEPKEL